jgi:predicted amidohydrolase YtcJ
MGPTSYKNAPLFVDAHVHIKNAEAIKSVLSAGVAAVRDAGMNDRLRMDMSNEHTSLSTPAILSADWALHQKGSYGSLLGIGVDTQDEIKSEILKLKQAGAGIIKVIASGLVSLREPGRVTAGGFNQEKLSFIVEEARRQDLDVMAHANGERAIEASIEAGVRSIEHGFFMTVTVLEKMAKKGIFWTPTVGALARAAGAATISAAMQVSISELIRAHIGLIGRAYEIGVPLAVGTDCVLPDPDYALKYKAELSYFEQAGISRADTWKIAGEGGSRLLGFNIVSS